MRHEAVGNPLLLSLDRLLPKLAALVPSEPTDNKLKKELDLVERQAIKREIVEVLIEHQALKIAPPLPIRGRQPKRNDQLLVNDDGRQILDVLGVATEPVETACPDLSITHALDAHMHRVDRGSLGLSIGGSRITGHLLEAAAAVPYSKAVMPLVRCQNQYR